MAKWTHIKEISAIAVVAFYILYDAAFPYTYFIHAYKHTCACIYEYAFFS